MLLLILSIGYIANKIGVLQWGGAGDQGLEEKSNEQGVMSNVFVNCLRLLSTRLAYIQKPRTLAPEP
jgi:hypothetical protein